MLNAFCSFRRYVLKWRHNRASSQGEDEPAPADTYGRSKLAAELALQAAGVPFTILRPVVIYGPHPKPASD